MRNQGIFTVDGVRFAVAPHDQARAARHLLDYRDGIGVIQIDAAEA
jgi:hypothetical protein